MPVYEFAHVTTRTEVRTLKVYAENGAAAKIKADNGPISEIIEKEGVELVRRSVVEHVDVFFVEQRHE